MDGTYCFGGVRVRSRVILNRMRLPVRSSFILELSPLIIGRISFLDLPPLRFILLILFAQRHI